MISFILLVFIACSAAQDFECLVTSPGVCMPYLYPYPPDCTKYYECDAVCISYLRDCPANLHFSNTTQQCESPADANCIVTTTASTTSSSPSSTASTTTTTTNTGTTPTVSTTTPANVHPSIFYACFNGDINGVLDPIYLVEKLDRRSDFGGTSFTAPIFGYYFFTLVAGWQSGRPATFSMNGNVQFGPRRQTQQSNGDDVISMDSIQNLNMSTVLSTSQDRLLGDLAGLTSTCETAWGGFSLENSMEVLSAFSVGRSDPYNIAGTVDFGRLVSNTGEWNFDNNFYRAPVAGTYYFSLSAGVDSTQSVRVCLTRNSVCMAELWRNTGWHENEDTLSRSVILNLNPGDVVEYRLQSGSLHSTAENLLTSFSGFLVDPYYAPTVAWGAELTTIWSSSTPDNVVPYNNAYVNEENVYNTTTHRVTIPYTGFYYVALSAGTRVGERVRLQLRKNQNTFLDRFERISTVHSTDTLSRSGIHYLNAGETLDVVTVATTGLYGDSTSKLTTFQGFLIYSNH